MAYIDASQELKIAVAEDREITNTPSPTLLKNKSKRTTFLSSIGCYECFSPEVWRASVGELLGIAVLVFIIDTIVISTFQMETHTPNLIFSTLLALMIAILLLAVAPVSRGHINPIISFAAALVGVISFSPAAIYIVAQCLGAVLGALVVRGSELWGVAPFNKTSRFGVVAPGPNGPVATGLEISQALWLEIICSFVFLFASVWMAFDGLQAKNLGPVIVCSIIGLVLGLLVFMSTTVTARKGYAGAEMNPARCFGPAIVRRGYLWNGLWVLDG